MTTDACVSALSAGPALKDAGSYLGAAVLVGLLKASSVSKGPLNLVSAPALATQLQLKVSVQPRRPRHDHDDDDDDDVFIE